MSFVFPIRRSISSGVGKRVPMSSIHRLIEDFVIPFGGAYLVWKRHCLRLEGQFKGTRRVIDISGDGSNNRGRPAASARDDLEPPLTAQNFMITSKLDWLAD